MDHRSLKNILYTCLKVSVKSETIILLGCKMGENTYAFGSDSEVRAQHQSMK